MLRYKARLSLKQSIDKISTHAIWGEHSVKPRPLNYREVSRILVSLGLNPDAIAKECRDYRVSVPCFENILSGNSWEFHSNGGSLQLVDNDTHEPTSESIASSGHVITSSYIEQFKSACEARDRAIEKASFTEVQTCAILGIASIETYLGSVVRSWNKRHPEDQLLDSEITKVSFDDKIDKWIPKIAGIPKLDKGDMRWPDFKRLQRIRNHTAIHSKVDGHVVSYLELAELINSFRFGIARFLGGIHLALGQPIPSIVVNAAFMPDVQVENSGR